jgi:hypothetical protein
MNIFKSKSKEVKSSEIVKLDKVELTAIIGGTEGDLIPAETGSVDTVRVSRPLRATE